MGSSFQRLSAGDGFWWALIAAACVVIAIGAALFAHVLHPGFNYGAYEYFSQYHAAHGAYPTAAGDAHAPYAAAYHDYTPFNGIVYRALFAAPQPLHQAVFTAYQIAMLAVGFACMLALLRRGRVAPLELLAVLVFFAADPLVFRMLLSDDKANFFALPMACILAYEVFGLAALGATIGLFAGWGGLGLAAVPLPLFARDKNMGPRLAGFALAVLVLAITFAVEGREVVGAVSNRAALENWPPLWFSIWRIVPDGGEPLLRKGVTVAYVLALLALFWLRRIPLVPAFVVIAAAYDLFSSSTSPQRVLFYLPALMFCFAQTRQRLAYLAASAVLMVATFLTYQGIYRHYGEHAPAFWVAFECLACNLPLLVPVGWVLWRARRPAPGDYYEALRA